MKDRLKHITKIKGSYYPENPERNTRAYHKRIDFTYENEKLTLTGTRTEITGQDKIEILMRIREAILGYLSNPKRESYPLIIRDII